MSTKKVTTNQYNAAGQSAYNQMMPQMSSALGGYMQNPLQSSFFQQMLGMSNASSGQQGQTQMSNLLRNSQGMGGGANPYLQSLQAQQGRATSGQMAGNFGGLLQNAVGNQLQATNIAHNFSPLQTGQTQTTGGVGSWLPQLLGGALGFATGGLSKLFSHGGGGQADISPFLGNGFGSNMSMPGPGGSSVMNYGQAGPQGYGGNNNNAMIKSAGGMS
jgi:hypothetical protein